MANERGRGTAVSKVANQIIASPLSKSGPERLRSQRERHLIEGFSVDDNCGVLSYI